MRGRLALGPLADRSFRRVWLAATTSAVGSAFIPVALAFAVPDLGGTATSLGLVLLTGTVAGLVSYLAGGVWADRVARRNLMLLGDVVRLAAESAVAVLLLTGTARIWELAATAGPGWAFAADAASFAGSAAFLLGVSVSGTVRAARQRFLADLAEGWREVAGRTWAAVIVVSAVVPALLPAVRVVVRHEDGTITGPAARV